MQYPQHRGRRTAPAWACAAVPPSGTAPRSAPPAIQSWPGLQLLPLRLLPLLLLATLPGLGHAMACRLPAADLEAAGAAQGPSPEAGQAGKFRLIQQSCADLAAAEAGPRRPAAAPRAAQLDLYDGAPVSGTLQEGQAAPALGASLPGPQAGARPRPAGPGSSSGPNRAERAQRIIGVAGTLSAAAERHDIDPLLLHAIAHVESRHNPQAISPAGARGLMQVMPATAKRFGLKDPVRELMQAPLNVEASAAYLKTLQARFGNDLRLVLAAYNAGEGAVERHGRRVPPYAETQAYVQQVLGAYQGLRDWAAAP